MHVVAANEGGEYVLRGHVLHEEDMLLVEKYPAEQLVHVVAGGAENLPAGHVRHAVALFCRLACVPPAHWVQFAVLMTLLKLPSGQFSHWRLLSVEHGTVTRWPVLHVVQKDPHTMSAVVLQVIVLYLVLSAHCAVHCVQLRRPGALAKSTPSVHE